MGPDDELVVRLRAGDEAAFVALVRMHQPSLLRVAESIVMSRSVAEEVVQDTWLAVVRGVDRFEGRSSVRTWLFHILVNRARTTAGREHRTAQAIGDDLLEQFGGEGGWIHPPVPWPDRVDDQVVAVGLARRVRTILPTLPDAQREVLVLRDIEGCTSGEVSSMLGVTDGHQRVLLHRARARVRRQLAAEMELA